jgi:hypothetical protein
LTAVLLRAQCLAIRVPAAQSGRSGRPHRPEMLKRLRTTGRQQP